MEFDHAALESCELHAYEFFLAVDDGEYRFHHSHHIIRAFRCIACPETLNSLPALQQAKSLRSSC